MAKSKEGKSDIPPVPAPVDVPAVPIEEIQVPKVVTFNPNKDTIIYLIWLLYKSNLLANNNLSQILKIIEQQPPEDILKYLVEQARKA